jgi:hypothetical protein
MGSRRSTRSRRPRRSLTSVVDPPSPEPSWPAPSGPSWAAVAPPDARGSAGAARRLGAYCWVEQQLFAVLGGWVPAIAEPDAKVLVAEHAEHAAWRAQRWFELLPTAPPGADALVVAPGGVEEVVACVLELGVHAGPATTKLCLAHQVLMPALLVAYTAHAGWASTTAEASTVRLLDIVGRDLGADVAEGQRLLAAIGGAPATTAGPRQQLEDLLAAAGGAVGPGSAGLRPA